MTLQLFFISIYLMDIEQGTCALRTKSPIYVIICQSMMFITDVLGIHVTSYILHTSVMWRNTYFSY